MIGRASYENVMEMAKIDQIIFDDKSEPVERRELMDKYGLYLDSIDKDKKKFNMNIKPTISLFHN